jgi:transposase
MLRRQAFKFELLPRGRQQRDMHRFAGACRYVFNQALALQKANYEGGGKFIGSVARLKAKRRVQATHARIGNARRDYLHKATTAISRDHARAQGETRLRETGTHRGDYA